MLNEFLHNQVSAQDFCAAFIEWWVERSAVLSDSERAITASLLDEVKHYYGPYARGEPLEPPWITDSEVKQAVRKATQELAELER